MTVGHNLYKSFRFAQIFRKKKRVGREEKRMVCLESTTFIWPNHDISMFLEAKCFPCETWLCTKSAWDHCFPKEIVAYFGEHKAEKRIAILWLVLPLVWMNILSALLLLVYFSSERSHRSFFKSALNSACGSGDLCPEHGRTQLLSSSQYHHPTTTDKRSLVSLRLG